MRHRWMIALSSLVLVGAATLAFRIEASFTKDEYVRSESPVIALSSAYEDGVWTVKGSTEVPTACTEVSASGALHENGSIRLDLTIGEDSGICLMLPTSKSYEVDVRAPEDAGLNAYVNGVKAIVEEL